MEPGGVAVIVVAAGRGDRYGGPKQYEVLGGRRVLDWSLAAARTVADQVVLVVAPERLDDPEPVADVVVAGGATRSGSVRSGLAAVDPAAEVVLVHDAARPLAPAGLFAAVVTAVRSGAAGAVPALPVTDTIKQVDGDTVVATMDRSRLVAVQTPQGFSAAALRAAHAHGDEATDDAALVESAGGRVVVVTGEPHNDKITDPGDLDVLERRLVAGASRGAPGHQDPNHGSPGHQDPNHGDPRHGDPRHGDPRHEDPR